MSDEDNDLLAKLLEERRKLLAKHPELRPVQAEIDRQLASVPAGPGPRIKKIFEMIDDIVENELKPELENLKEKIDEASSKVNSPRDIPKRKVG